jgi:hypothetical protein
MMALGSFGRTRLQTITKKGMRSGLYVPPQLVLVLVEVLLVPGAVRGGGMEVRWSSERAAGGRITSEVADIHRSGHQY